MKLIKIQENLLKFDDGTIIEGSHNQDCCEINYIDFEGSLNNILELNQEFKTIEIKKDTNTTEYGFDLYLDNIRYPINCYSDQNGYYSDNVDVTLSKNNKVITEFNTIGEQRY